MYFICRVRCDRRHPCGTCSRRGLAQSCIYNTDSKDEILPQSGGTVHERIHQLETLVISLMRQETSSTGSQEREIDSVPKSDPPSCNAQNTQNGQTSETSYPISESQSSAVESFASGNAIDVEAKDDVSPTPLDCGSLKLNSLGDTRYVSSPHWAAILDSIIELKDHVEHEGELCKNTTDGDAFNSVHSSWPQLLYGCPRVTQAEIISSMPPRAVVDKLVSRYFTLDTAPSKSVVSRSAF